MKGELYVAIGSCYECSGEYVGIYDTLREAWANQAADNVQMWYDGEYRGTYYYRGATLES